MPSNKARVTCKGCGETILVSMLRSKLPVWCQQCNRDGLAGGNLPVKSLAPDDAERIAAIAERVRNEPGARVPLGWSDLEYVTEG